jgi:GNAT superfamily N-acetyltransferase
MISLEKKHWHELIKFDTSIYGVYMNPSNKKFLCVSTTSHKTQKMLARIVDTIKNGDWYHTEVNTMIENPIKVYVSIKSDTNDYLNYASDNLICFKNEEFKLEIFPYHDGIMIHSLIVNDNKRGNGIGSQVMNTLYDISEDMGIPLYIIPFPAVERFDQSKIFDIIEPLKRWYSNIGFGPVDGHPTIWSNY